MASPRRPPGVVDVSATTGRRRVYGIDFSGAKDAGDNVWLASATRRADTLVVEGVFPGTALPGSGPSREHCLPALRNFLAGANDAVVGMDFPFGLPAELVDDGTWPAFLGGFPNGADGPQDWAGQCRDRAEALDRDRVELKRATDEETGAPFSPYNLRLQAATYYGLSKVLRPLVEAEAASVLPMQPPNPGVTWLVEACPSVTVERLGIDAEGYKDPGEEAAERRAEILDLLEEGPATVVPAVRAEAVDDAEGDALDAVVAAVGVANALDRGDPFAPGTVDARSRIEGRIYA